MDRLVLATALACLLIAFQSSGKANAAENKLRLVSEDGTVAWTFRELSPGIWRGTSDAADHARCIEKGNKLRCYSIDGGVSKFRLPD